MRLLERLTENRRNVVIVAGLIILLAASIRFYHIGWSFSNNGVDEGVMLQRSLLIDYGFELYTELPCDQAPFAFYIGAIFSGDVVTLRSLEVALSIFAILACMAAARRISGDIAMLATGLFLAVDFAFLRESRLYSLDGMASYFLAFSFLALVYYIQKDSRVALVVGGLLMGVSASVKLLGAFGVVGVLLFFIIEVVRERSLGSKRAVDMALFFSTSILPLVLFLAVLDTSAMLQGMIFDQAHREFEPFLKLAILAYLGLNLSYILPFIYARSLWSAGREIRLLMVVSAVLLLLMLFQPLVFFHHLVLMSPSLAILAGVVTAETVRTKKSIKRRTNLGKMLKKNTAMRRFAAAVILMDVVASAGLAFYGIAAQGEPSEIAYAEMLRDIADGIENLTGNDTWVICGDPLIATQAGVLTPPQVANVAYRRYPQLTLDDVTNAIDEYNVSVVVVCFRLKDIGGLTAYLRENNYSMILPRYIGSGNDTVLDLFEDSIDPVYFYIKNDLAFALDIPILMRIKP
ncbi:MAG: phospholipid carrier-dependent glycosyltransferase [Thermoplasmata archaeon]|nr:phospholipid carrier-dependent glycosyltransferase [Thermoplasmata archaeon]TFG69902.1 MAG: phospholipid carrier-dependent glycosyltransferase [Methanomassiliicoccus sp.]